MALSQTSLKLIKKGAAIAIFCQPIDSTALMQWQQDAESGKHDWAFDDPQRVASNALAALAKVDLALLTNMKLMREAQGRKIYELKGPGKPRPSWLW